MEARTAARGSCSASSRTAACSRSGSTNEPQRRLLEWVLSFVFYAAIALVIMVWLWPMTRDLRDARALDGDGSATATGASTRASRRARRSIRWPQAFRRMAARIDGLIGSHKDMSNALSHEIKTPLARMRFEIELARAAADREAAAAASRHI